MSLQNSHRNTIWHLGSAVLMGIALFALAAGAWVYIALRPGWPVFVTRLQAWGFGNSLNAIRENALPWVALVPDDLLYSLPSGLWALSYTLLMALLWRRSSRMAYMSWTGSGLLLTPGWEWLEGSQWVSGTFCPTDMAFGVAGALLAICILPHQKTSCHEKRNLFSRSGGFPPVGTG